MPVSRVIAKTSNNCSALLFEILPFFWYNEVKKEVTFFSLSVFSVELYLGKIIRCCVHMRRKGWQGGLDPHDFENFSKTRLFS